MILVSIQITKIVNAEKKKVDKLVDECTETGSSYTVYSVLFWIFFTISISGIGAYFIFTDI